MWACCRYTRERFECTHGDVLNAHTGRGGGEEEGEGGSSPVLLTKMAHVEVSLSQERFTESNHWMLPISNFRIGRERHVSDSSFHSQNPIKLFNSSSPEGNFGECATSTNTHTHTTHTHTHKHNTQQHSTPHHTNTYNTETEIERERRIKEKRQDKTRHDCRQLATLRESWFLLLFVRACVGFLTALSFRALHGNHIMSTPFQTIVEEDKQKIVAHLP